MCVRSLQQQKVWRSLKRQLIPCLGKQEMTAFNSESFQIEINLELDSTNQTPSTVASSHSLTFSAIRAPLSAMAMATKAQSQKIFEKLKTKPANRVSGHSSISRRKANNGRYALIVVRRIQPGHPSLLAYTFA
jgi:hypothetical protein